MALAMQGAENLAEFISVVPEVYDPELNSGGKKAYKKHVRELLQEARKQRS
jgi:hypothetical protein